MFQLPEEKNSCLSHLEVAVDDPPVVHRLQRHHDLRRVGPRGGLGQPAARPEVPEELAAADKLEREKDVRRVLCGFNSPPPFFLNSISFCVFLFRFS